MAIYTTCPGCDASFRIPESLCADRIRCQACQTVFVVDVPGLRRPQPMRPPAPPSLPQPAGPAAAPPIVPDLHSQAGRQPEAPLTVLDASGGPPANQQVPTVLPVSSLDGAVSRRPPVRPMRPQHPVEPQRSGPSALSIVLGLIVVGGIFLLGASILLFVFLFILEVQREDASRQDVQVPNPPQGMGVELDTFSFPLWQWGPGDVASVLEEQETGDRALLDHEVKNLDRAADGPRKYTLENPVPVLSREELGEAALTAEGSLPREVLQRVEDATVRLRVAHPDRTEGIPGEGSGFFALEPGIVVTNAHVVGMKQPDSPPPTQIEVIVYSGETNERKLTAEVLLADGHIDLALLKIRERDAQLPEPLRVVSARNLHRTQQLVAFGFPYGQELNARLSASKVSVASFLRENGELHRVQLNGELNPGNSGGPVVDAQGRVVGVAVSIYVNLFRNTGISFAVPAEQVLHLFQGRLGEMTVGQPVKNAEDTGVTVPVSIQVLDPLRRVRKVGVAWATGGMGEKHGPSLAEPELGGAQRTELTIDQGLARGELKLPSLPAGQVYWLQPYCLGRRNQARSMAAVSYEPAEPIERKPAELADLGVVSGGRLSFEHRSTLLERGQAAGNAAPLVISLSGELERQAEESPGQKFTGFDIGVRIGDRPLPRQALRTFLQRRHPMAGELARDAAYASAGEFNQELAALSEIIQESFQFLDCKLPGSKVAPGQTWTARHRLALEVVDNLRTSPVEITFTYLGSRKREGREEAAVGIEGAFTSEEGIKGSGRLQGLAWVDLGTNQISTSRADLEAVLEMPLMLGQGTTQLSVRTQAHASRARPMP